MVKIFIDNKAEMIDVKNDKGKTPLSVAATVNGEFLKNIRPKHCALDILFIF